MCLISTGWPSTSPRPSRMTSGPLRYYAPIQGHELEHKLPPIVSTRWRRITFILTTGDRFRTRSKSMTSSSKKARPVSYT
ncbi:MAG: hypothetical protein P8017_13155 [Deltaproteobacteria bacterium]